MTMTDVDQMLVNEYNALQRHIVQRERDLIEIEDELRVTMETRAYIPRWYNVEFDFEAGTTEPQERSFFVNGGTYFRPKTIGSALRAVGAMAVVIGPTAADIGEGRVINATLPWGPSLSADKSYSRQAYFDYFWQVRDTNGDLWQNQPQPSVFMCGGGLSNLALPVPGTVRGGTEVFVKISPFFSRSGTTLGLFHSVSRYKLTVSFFGLEAR